MRSILKLARSNIRHGKGSFIGIIVLMMLMTFSFTGTVSNDDNLKRALDDRYEANNISEVLIYIYDDMLTDEMLEELDSYPEVDHYVINDHVLLNTPVRSNGGEVDTNMELCPVDENMQMFTEDGKEVRHVDVNPGEIYLPYKVHRMEEFAIGNEITIRTHDGWSEPFVIKGYWEDVLMGAVTSSDNRAVISREDYDALIETGLDSFFSDTRYAVLNDEICVYAAQGVSEDELRAVFDSDSDIVRASSGMVTRDEFKDIVSMYASIGTKTVVIFVAMLMVVILITINNCITSSIEMDYTELGVLKSQGFTNGDIRKIYVIQYMLALFIGAVLGLLISVPSSVVLIGLFTNITGLRTGVGVSFGKCIILSLLIMAVSCLFICIATSKVGRISPVRAISGGKEEMYFDNRLKVRIRKSPLSFFIALRDLQSGLKNYAGTLVITAIMVFFIATIGILKDGLDVDKIFINLDGDIKIENMGGFNLCDVDEVLSEVQSSDPDATIEVSFTRRMVVEDELLSVTAYITDRDLLRPTEGRGPVYDNEICITKGVAELIGKGIGDTVTIGSVDSEEDYVVTGYFDTAWNFGYIVDMTPEGMERLGYDEVGVAYVTLSDTSKSESIADSLNEKYGSFLKAESYEEGQTTVIYKDMIGIIMNAFSYTITAVIIVFAAVIVIMVSKRAFIRERKDIGILKSLGFTAGNLRSQFSIRFVIVAAAGSAFGSILAMLFSRRLLIMILQIVGLTDFTSDYPPIVFFGPALIICTCYLLCSYLISARVKRVEVRELITE